ncbi:hypothetical protein JCM17823_17300 [Halorubrum gandharaense]
MDDHRAITRRTAARRLAAAGSVGALAGVAGCAGDRGGGGDDGSGDSGGGPGDGGSDDPFEPLGRLPLAHAYEVVVSADGAVGYVAGGDRFYTVDLTDPTEPAVLAERTELLADHPDGPLELIWDCKVDGDDLLVVGPAQARPRVVDAALHYDVSDPTDPELLAVHETSYPIHNCDVADGYAYLTGNTEPGNPVVVVDLEAAAEAWDGGGGGDGGDGGGDGGDGSDGEGEGTTAEVARWSVFEADPAWENVGSSLRPVHDVWVEDGVAYAAYWDAGTHLLDVSDPTGPTRIGGVGPYEPDDLAGLTSRERQRERTMPPGNHHFARPSDDGTLLGVNAEAWAMEVDGELEGYPGGIHLYDLTDPTSLDHLATIEAPESPDPTYEGVWTTSHNFEIRNDRLYASWYEGGVTLHDLSDPADPVEIAAWRDPANASFWTAQSGVPGEFVVATSTDERPAEPALYTFPDRAGEQEDPPPLEDALDEEGEDDGE